MAEKLEKDDWQVVRIADMTGGIQTDDRDDLIKENQSPNLENLWFDRRTLRIDTGYEQWLGAVDGNPQMVFQFFLTNGTSFVCLLTDSSFYVKGTGAWWEYVSDGTSDTLAANAAASAISGTTAGTATFTAGDQIGITLDSGNQHQPTVVSHVGTTLTWSVGLPSAAASGNVIVKAIDLSGDLDIQPSMVVMPAVDWLIITNGVDNVMRFDGSTIEDVPNLPSAGNTQARIVRILANHLLLMHTTEGGTAYPQRVRRSDTADPTNWTTGNAGASDLLDTEGQIVAAKPLGPYIIVYKDRNIIRMEYIGSDDALFNFDTMVQREGAISGLSVINRDDFHIFIGNSNVYKYRGGFDIEPIGQDIYYAVFGHNGRMNSEFKQRSFAVFLEELNEAWVFFPADADEMPKHVARLQVDTGAWTIRQLTDPMIGFGLLEETLAITWAEASGSWLNYSYPWNTQRSLSNSPIILLCEGDNNLVHRYNYVTPTDDGVAIDWFFETKDFVEPGFQLRVDWLEVFVAGGSVDVTYSVDEGANFTAYETIPVSAEQRAVRLFGDAGQFVGDSVRWRLSGSGDGFKIGWMKMKFKLESQW